MTLVLACERITGIWWEECLVPSTLCCFSWSSDGLEACIVLCCTHCLIVCCIGTEYGQSHFTVISLQSSQIQYTMKDRLRIFWHNGFLWLLLNALVYVSAYIHSLHFFPVLCHNLTCTEDIFVEPRTYLVHGSHKLYTATEICEMESHFVQTLL